MIDIFRESLSAESDYRLEIVQVASQSAPIGRAGAGGSLNLIVPSWAQPITIMQSRVA